MQKLNLPPSLRNDISLFQDDSKTDLELSEDEVSKDSSFQHDDSSFQSLHNGDKTPSKETSGGEKSKLESRLSSADDTSSVGGKKKHQNGAKMPNGDVTDGSGEEEGWKQYLGASDGELTNILIR